ncbi:hypothetical protein WJX74_005589 [Apatococcus lobatus]|uniref:Uncharacterized protein n=1 Tax=Apatococcus lobatus TaxID=904363 RepID=A0AAW1RV74_9CHLO
MSEGPEGALLPVSLEALRWEYACMADKLLSVNLVRLHRACASRHAGRLRGSFAAGGNIGCCKMGCDILSSPLYADAEQDQQVAAFIAGTQQQLQLWNGQHAESSLLRLLTAFQLQHSVSPLSVSAALVATQQQAECPNSESNKREQTLLQECRDVAADKNWFPEQPRTTCSADQPAFFLRAAAIVMRTTVYVFDLDTDPACCQIYFALRPPVKICNSSGTLITRVEDLAWALVLGRDRLPRQLLSSGQQAHKIAVLAHAKGVYHPCLPSQFISSQPAPEAAEEVYAALGIEFQDVAFKRVNKRGPAAQRKREATEAGSEADISDDEAAGPLSPSTSANATLRAPQRVSRITKRRRTVDYDKGKMLEIFDAADPGGSDDHSPLAVMQRQLQILSEPSSAAASALCLLQSSGNPDQSGSLAPDHSAAPLPDPDAKAALLAEGTGAPAASTNSADHTAGLQDSGTVSGSQPADEQHPASQAPQSTEPAQGNVAQHNPDAVAEEGAGAVPAASELFAKSMNMLSAHLQQMNEQSPPTGLQLANDPQLLIVKAAIAPFSQHHAELRAQIGALRSEVKQLSDRVQSNDSFLSLAAAGFTQMSQQLQSMQKMLSAIYHQPGGHAASSAHFPGQRAISHPALQVVASAPAKRQAARVDKAQDIARRQLQAAADRMGQPLSEPGMQASATLTAADIVLNVPESLQIRVVYPGIKGEPYWTSWNGRWPVLTDYPNLVDIYKEWEEGIIYSTGKLKTVPMKQLEQDKAEGRQEWAWRGGGVSRTAMLDRKAIIYMALNAQRLDDIPPEILFNSVQAKAESELAELPRGHGPKPKMVARAKTILSSEYPQYHAGQAVQFEQQVLGWSICSGLAAQAKSRAVP